MGLNKHIIRLGILCTLSLAAASCTKEHQGTEKPLPDGYGYVSFSINPSMVLRDKSRSTNVEGLDWGREEENYVEKVRVILYSYNSSSAEYVFDFKIRSREQADAPNPSWTGFVEDNPPTEEAGKHLYKSDNDYQFITFARKVKRQSYYVVVLINPSQEILDNTEIGSSANGFENNPLEIPTEHIMDKSNGGLAADNYFFMSNLQSLFVITPAKLMVTEEEAHAEPVSILVARAVAKVSLTDNIPSVPGGSKADNYSWQLDVTSKHTYWLRRPAEKITEQGISGDYEEYEEIVYDIGNTAPLLNYLKSIYSMDYAYEGISQFNYDYSTSEAERQDFFNYLRYSASGETPLLTNQLGGYEYCLENTAAPADFYEDVLTSAVVRCRYTPESYGEDESYFVFAGYLIDVPTMQSYIDDPTSIPPALKTLKLPENIDKATAAGELTTPVASLARSFEFSAIKYYYQGINYYRIIIEHTALPSAEKITVDPAKFYGRYGVLRNNHYAIKIKSLKGPGSPTVVSADRQSISASIVIQGWQERQSDIEIN